jgi:hypothetical protein
LSNKIDRRRFLQRCLLGTGLASTFPGIPFASDAEKVDEGAALAVSMGYKHDALKVDTDRFPKRSGLQGESQYCFNCALYQGDTDDAWAACEIFQNKQVAGKGWCNAWVAIS